MNETVETVRVPSYYDAIAALLQGIMEVVKKDITVNPQQSCSNNRLKQVVVEQAGCCCVPSTASVNVKVVRQKLGVVVVLHNVVLKSTGK